VNPRSLLVLLVLLSSIPIAIAADAPSPSLTLRRLPWAGIQLTTGNATLLIDAIAGARSPIAADKDIAIDTTATQRFALASHHHGDHYDRDALLAALGDRGLLVLQRAVADWADARGLRVQLVEHYQPVMLPRSSAAFVAFAVPAADGFGHPQVSWVIDVAGRRLLHAGDTPWHGHWWDIARAYGPFDAVFLPVNGFRQTDARIEDSGVPMSLMPEQAVEVARILKARALVPIHYGGGGENYLEQDGIEGRLRTAAAKASVTLRVLAAGESWQMDAGVGRGESP